MSPEQWKRIHAALQPYGGPRYGQHPYWAMTVQASWWWFVLLPAAALIVFRLRRIRVLATAAMLVGIPSLLALGVAFVVVR